MEVPQAMMGLLQLGLPQRALRYPHLLSPQEAGSLGSSFLASGSWPLLRGLELQAGMEMVGYSDGSLPLGRWVDMLPR